jgi:hypothetical protein
MSDYKKPVPLPGPISQPFFDGTKRHELMLIRCSSCGAHRLAERPSCPECWSDDYEWVRGSGRGTVYTYAIMHQQLHPGFADEIPYNVAVIELEEGPRIVSNVVECENANLHVGLPVEVVFDDITEECTLLRFRPCSI